LLAAGLSLPAAAAFIEACASGSPPPTSGTVSGTLTFFFGGAPDEVKTRQKVIDAFTAKFPKVTVKTKVAGSDPLQELLTACVGGSCPDVMMAWELLYPALAKRNVYLDLGPLIKADSAFSQQVVPDYSSVLLNTFKFSDRQVALPEQFAGIFLYYNRKLFEQAGVPVPSADWKDTAWNYDAFLSAAQKLTKRDASGKVTQWGFVDVWAPFLSAHVFAANNGVDWMSPAINPKKTNIGDPRFVKGLQLYADLINKYKVSPTSEQTGSVSTFDLFTSGKAAMALTGHWFYPAFSGAKDLDFEVAALPVGPDGKSARSDIGTTGLAIAASSPNQKAAWEFVKFSCGPEGQKIIAQSGLFIPVLKSVANSADFSGAHSKIKNAKTLASAIENATPLPITPAYGNLEPAIIRETTQLLAGKQTAQQFADKLGPQIDSQLGAAL
jgi:multiple sugar transport system substrate-binding protein